MQDHNNKLVDETVALLWMYPDSQANIVAGDRGYIRILLGTLARGNDERARVLLEAWEQQWQAEDKVERERGMQLDVKNRH